MNIISTAKLREMLMYVCDTIIGSEPYLTEIDTVIGDGDHGIGMKTGFSAMRGMLESHTDFPTVAALMKQCGLELVKTMGGASGVLFGTLFTGGMEALGSAADVTAAELAEFFRQSEKAIEKRGRTRYGQKTMLDALLPAVERMQAAAEGGASCKEALRAAYEGAREGAEKSKDFISRVGRSKNFREVTVGHPDPGAVSVSLIFKALYESIEN